MKRLVACLIVALTGCTSAPLPPAVPRTPPPTPTQAPIAPFISPSPPAFTPAPTEAPSPSPSQPSSGDLRILLDYQLPFDLLVMAPRFDQYRRGTRLISDRLYDRLYEPDPQLLIVPQVAEGMPDYQDDGRTWVVRLRDGISFHDGSPMTASDVAFSFELARSHTCHAWWTACDIVARRMTGVQARDDRTIVFRFSEPFAPFLALAMADVPILPESAVRQSADRLAQTAAQVDRTAVTDLVARMDSACEADGSHPGCEERIADEVAQMLGAGGAFAPRAPAPTAPPLDAVGEYHADLKSRLKALEAGLRSVVIDRIAAWLPILDIAGAPIGSGPFRFDALEDGRLELVAHEVYFAGRPRIPRVALLAFDPWTYDDTAPTAGDLLAAGEVDLALRVDDWRDLDPEVRVAYPPGFEVTAFHFNLRPGHLFVQSSLRRAFALCLDRPPMAEAASDGKGTVVDSFVHPSSWASDDKPPAARNVEMARSLIRRGGWTMGRDGIFERDGRRLATNMIAFGTGSHGTATAQFASDQLRECGIDFGVLEADLATLPEGPWVLPDGDIIVRDQPALADPDMFELFHSSRIYDLETRPDGLNLSAWSHPGGDQLLEEGRRELDPDDRRAIYERFQDLLRLEAPVIPMFVNGDAVGLAASVRSTDGPMELGSPRFWWNLEDWEVAATPN